MALNSGLKTVKDILADIKTLTSKDEFHTGTHVLLAKTKAGKFAGSITWITSTDKKLINTKRVGTDVYNAHSLNFFMILPEEFINIAYQSLTRFISDVQSPEFDKAVRMGSLPDWTGFIPILIRTTNTVHQDLVKYFREFFAGLPEREDLVWEYAYEPPLDKPLGGYNPHDVLKEQIGIREYACCALGAFKNAKVYFVDSLKGLCQLEADLKRTDLVKTERRDMEQWFDYPEPRGKIIRLNNFDSVMVLHYGECGYLSGWRNTAHSVIAHEALHVVLSLCKHINYNPLNEQEPAAYAMEFITLEALGYYLPRMERISE